MRNLLSANWTNLMCRDLNDSGIGSIERNELDLESDSALMDKNDCADVASLQSRFWDWLGEDYSVVLLNHGVNLAQRMRGYQPRIRSSVGHDPDGSN